MVWKTWQKPGVGERSRRSQGRHSDNGSSRTLDSAAVAAIVSAVVAAIVTAVATIIVAVVTGNAAHSTKDLEGKIQERIKLLEGTILRELKQLDVATQKEVKEREIAAQIKVMEAERELKRAELNMKETEAKVARLDFAYRTFRDSITHSSWPVRKAAAISIANALQRNEAASFFGAFMVEAPKMIQKKDVPEAPEDWARQIGEFGVDVLVWDKRRSLDNAVSGEEESFKLLIQCLSDRSKCEEAREKFASVERNFPGYHAAFEMMNGLTASATPDTARDLLKKFCGYIPSSLRVEAQKLGIKCPPEKSKASK